MGQGHNVQINVNSPKSNCCKLLGNVDSFDLAKCRGGKHCPIQFW